MLLVFYVYVIYYVTFLILLIQMVFKYYLISILVFINGIFIRFFRPRISGDFFSLVSEPAGVAELAE